jgi:hypothetical protein
MPRATNNGGPREEGVGASAMADQALAVPVEPVARLDPAGFDPSRLSPLDRELFDALDASWRTLRSLSLSRHTQMFVPSAKTLQRLGLVERRHGPGYLSLYRRLV